MTKDKKKIGWLQSASTFGGGLVHDKTVIRVLSKEFDVEIIDVGIKEYRTYMYPKIVYNLSTVSGEKDLWIREFDEIIAMPFDKTTGKNMGVVYHIDRSTRPPYLRPFYCLLERVFYKNLWDVDVIVTICQHFKKHFTDKGYRDVRVIYPGFDVSMFNFSNADVESFKRRHNLTGKPIVYIGNCQRAKGVVESYNTLRGMDVHLVTSGEERVKIPAKNLNLNYRDYLLLLKASSVVVTMSKFIEGWLLTAHEAMLCKTPVVGSPGLREILEGGEQIVCDDFSKLRENVEYLIERPEVGERGYDYVKQFTYERFEREWIGLIKEILE